jgi:hypothetical protein
MQGEKPGLRITFNGELSLSIGIVIGMFFNCECTRRLSYVSYARDGNDDLVLSMRSRENLALA